MSKPRNVDARKAGDGGVRVPSGIPRSAAEFRSRPGTANLNTTLCSVYARQCATQAGEGAEAPGTCSLHWAAAYRMQLWTGRS